MYALLPYFGIVCGVGMILLVIIKNIPASGDEELLAWYHYFSLRQYISHRTMERADKYAATFWEKTLRKIRVMLLKAEHFVSIRLRSLNKGGRKEHLFHKETILPTPEENDAEKV
ncbi:MAG: hypothetical protein KGI50_02810 [Patescibacteria group bacterium]|nr:hypothetical protein [Patescibacteria group bacterium]MDE2438562.1 hypothetical protein [Patescibacteria group bacterium]